MALPVAAAVAVAVALAEDVDEGAPGPPGTAGERSGLSRPSGAAPGTATIPTEPFGPEAAAASARSRHHAIPTVIIVESVTAATAAHRSRTSGRRGDMFGPIDIEGISESRLPSPEDGGGPSSPDSASSISRAPKLPCSTTGTLPEAGGRLDTALFNSRSWMLPTPLHRPSA